MKRIALLLLALLFTPPLFGDVCSHAEVFLIADETQLPAGWSEKELFRLTALDTERSDAMLLQCGGENMMIDGGSPMYYPRLEAWFEEHDITEL